MCLFIHPSEPWENGIKLGFAWHQSWHHPLPLPKCVWSTATSRPWWWFSSFLFLPTSNGRVINRGPAFCSHLQHLFSQSDHFWSCLHCQSHPSPCLTKWEKETWWQVRKISLSHFLLQSFHHSLRERTSKFILLGKQERERKTDVVKRKK